MIYLTGTNGQNWRSFADQLSAANPQSISLAVPSAKNLTSPGTEVICFAECPASLIAARAEDPSVTLERWKKSAGVLLALWRKSRQRVAILNWDECLADAAAFDQWLSDQIQTESGKAPGPLPTTQTSLASRVIAEVIVAQDREATRLWNELRVASLPIAKDFGGPRGASPALALRELAQQQEETLKTHEMLLQEIQNAHKESEDFFGQLEIARTNCEAAKEELTSVKGAHASGKQELERAQGELAALHSELQSTKENALRNYEMLLQEIHNAHIESEDFFQQGKLAQATHGAIHAHAEQMIHIGTSNGRSHSHIEFVLRGIRLFDRVIQKLRVRLIWHHAKPGIAIFREELNAQPPLYHWNPSGEEAGVEYSLFVPGDRAGKKKLLSAPATDLALVRSASNLIYSYLRVHGLSGSELWTDVALDLIHRLNEVPHRIHYDSVATAPVTQPVTHSISEKSFSFKLRNPIFLNSHATSFDFFWRPAHGVEIKDLAYNKQFLPRAMRDKLGAPTDSIHILLSKDGCDQHLAAKWANLSNSERWFLLLLLKALPDFVFHLCEQHPDQKQNKERLTKQARQLYRRLRNLDRRHRLKGAIAKLIRR
jgi:hypothetical protein